MSHYLTLKKIGQAVAYYPNLTRKLGSVNASILLSQFIYWHDKTENPLGVYKTQAEIHAETGLSRKEQETGRKVLRELGLITETYKRTEHKLYFLFHPDVFDAWFNDEAMPESDIRECDKVTFGNDQNVHSGMTESDIPPMPESDIRYIHKSTNENTTEITNTKGDSDEKQKPKDEPKQPNISFDEFWNAYDKKVGDKDKICKKWLGLSDDERLATMKHIAQYKAAQPNKKYRKNPETYLNQKSWNDEVIFDDSQKRFGSANDSLAVNQKHRPGQSSIVAPNTTFDFTGA